VKRLVPSAVLVRIGSALFEAVGSPAVQAGQAAADLVASSLMGHDSHGVIRIPEYLDLVDRGAIVPGASLTLEMTSETTAIADCGRNFGQVGATFAIEAAVSMAAIHKVACVVTRHCNHVGRLGSYVQAAAERDMIALATCNSPFYGHFVLPWGGVSGRLGTNPLAYAVPSSGDPIVSDISTCVAPEGKVRLYKNTNRPVPEGWIVDAEGRPTTDPNAFYGPPRGSILPLGGPAGHKGFALGLLVDLLGSPLAGRATDDPNAVGNGVCFLVFDPAAFGPLDAFKAQVDATIAYVKSGAGPEGEVLMPGELEFRTRRKRLAEGVPVDDLTWDQIHTHAARLGVDMGALTTWGAS
jgi:uncharacterized oxidoreductase